MKIKTKMRYFGFNFNRKSTHILLNGMAQMKITQITRELGKFFLIVISSLIARFRSDYRDSASGFSCRIMANRREESGGTTTPASTTTTSTTATPEVRY